MITAIPTDDCQYATGDNVRSENGDFLHDV